MGEQHVEADRYKAFFADFWGLNGRFFINQKDVPCNTTFASDPTGNKSNLSYVCTRRMEFTLKLGEVLLATFSEVVEHRFRIVCFTGLPHHVSRDVGADLGHGCQMAVIFEVEDRPIPIGCWVAQDAHYHLSLHLVSDSTCCWNSPISASRISCL